METLTIKGMLIIGVLIGGIISAIATAIAKWKFVSKKTFERRITKMQESLCKKFDGLDETIKDMDNKREAAKDVLADELKVIAKFIGKVQQYMENHKT